MTPSLKHRLFRSNTMSIYTSSITVRLLTYIRLLSYSFDVIKLYTRALKTNSSDGGLEALLVAESRYPNYNNQRIICCIIWGFCSSQLSHRTKQLVFLPPAQTWWKLAAASRRRTCQESCLIVLPLPFMLHKCVIQMYSQPQGDNEVMESSTSYTNCTFRHFLRLLSKSQRHIKAPPGKTGTMISLM